MLVNVQSFQIKTGERKRKSGRYSKAPVFFPWPGYYEIALHVCLSGARIIINNGRHCSTEKKKKL